GKRRDQRTGHGDDRCSRTFDSASVQDQPGSSRTGWRNCGSSFLYAEIAEGIFLDTGEFVLRSLDFAQDVAMRLRSECHFGFTKRAQTRQINSTTFHKPTIFP